VSINCEGSSIGSINCEGLSIGCINCVYVSMIFLLFCAESVILFSFMDQQ
jgi:hypothetical protein